MMWTILGLTVAVWVVLVGLVWLAVRGAAQADAELEQIERQERERRGAA